MNLFVGTTAGAFTLENPTEPLIHGTRINHISRQGDAWWALDGKARVHHNGDILATAGSGVALNCVQPADDTVWVGGTQARLFRLKDADLVEDALLADAPGRDQWYTPWGGPPDVRSMAIDASGTLFINIHVGGILRHDGTGLSPTLDQDADVHQVIAHPDRAGMVLAASARGLAQSVNGRDFEFRDDGLHADYCRAVAVVGDTVLVSASTGPRTSRARLYRADLGAGPFHPCADGLPESFANNLDTHCLAVVDGSVFAGLGGTLWRSDDEGGSWTEAAAGLPQITCLA